MKTYQTSSAEAGNVLFLILIAVALFAALSYAVTSSTSSGGGNANEESNLVNSAALTQYPASVKTAIIRMQVSKGVSTELIAFNLPPYTTLGDVSQGVFHPSGGGASYTQATTNVMVQGGSATNSDGDWFFNGNLAIENIGTTEAEIIAYLPGVSTAVCARINRELNVASATIPTINADLNASYRVNMIDDDTDGATPSTNLPGTAVDVIEVATTNTLAGEPFGCFANPTTAENVYYHVLLDR